MKILHAIALAVLIVLASTRCFAVEPISISGIYPHLAMFNNEGECGTGAVVSWAGRLWVVTYAPHAPSGSSDKLYEISSDLVQTIRPESIGGTPANRMIHRESQQLFIGPYAIDAQGNVRAIPYAKMYGRPTGNARHLFDPAGKIYFATMEEGLYEVDVKTLEVTELWADEQKKSGRHAGLPGYHGKGLYSSQGRILYANNGDHASEARKRPDVASGVLASWDGKADQWTIVRRNQFTEVTGPGGIFGNEKQDDLVWTIGWDHRSLILMCLDSGQWHSWRLPKASHSYDGAHGWNTEWPRIRDIGEQDLLMTMHGMFWKFPKTFSATNSAGIAPRSSYLKVIGDFCSWKNRIVFGCDDTAKNEFLNKRKAKGEIAAPQSQSNLWFVEPALLDQFGPNIGRGGVWVKENVSAGKPSDPYLFNGYERKGLQLAHATDAAAKITIEVDRDGTGQWKQQRVVHLPAKESLWIDLTEEGDFQWLRLTSDIDLKAATAWFNYSQADRRQRVAAELKGIAMAGERGATGGIVRALGENKRVLHFLAQQPGQDGPQDIGLYQLDADLKLTPVDDSKALKYQKEHAAIPVGVLAEDSASIIFTDDENRKWRLPWGNEVRPAMQVPALPARVCREVATERDLFNAGGTFYELPAQNAGGFAKVRAVSTHGRQISDFCSYRGLFVISGVKLDDSVDGKAPHIIQSDDGKAALWVGAIDDIWKFGKPQGVGGPWNATKVKAGLPSDPYLMTGFDKKQLTLSHDSNQSVKMRIEIDPSGSGEWLVYQTIAVEPSVKQQYDFPAAFDAAWVRIVTDVDCSATASFIYQ